MFNFETRQNSWQGLWKEPPARPVRVNRGEAHLWQLRPSTAWADQLLPRERERFGRIRHPESKAEFAVSQAGLRALLSLYRSERPVALPIRRGARGKPSLDGGPEFNLSHTAGGIFVAVSGSAVGLDVEAAGRQIHSAALARKFFAEEERDALLALEDKERNQAFIRCWVAKEAMVKLSGEGIFAGLREARVMAVMAGKIQARYRNKWVGLHEFWPRKDLRAALATWEPVVLKGFFRL